MDRISAYPSECPEESRRSFNVKGTRPGSCPVSGTSRSGLPGGKNWRLMLPIGGLLPSKPLFAAGPKGKNVVMRPLAYLVVALGAVYFLYQYSLKRMPVSDSGTAPTQAITLTGVRADLLQIADAQRANIVQSGQCA